LRSLAASIHRQRDQIGPALLGHEVGRQRHLGDIEFLVPQHAPEGVLVAQQQDVEVDPFGPHPPVEQR
jgi:hypothetical protein